MYSYLYLFQSSAIIERTSYILIIVQAPTENLTKTVASDYSYECLYFSTRSSVVQVSLWGWSKAGLWDRTDEKSKQLRGPVNMEDGLNRLNNFYLFVFILYHNLYHTTPHVPLFSYNHRIAEVSSHLNILIKS